MKKILYLLLCLLALSACGQPEEKDTTFQGVVEDVTSQSVLVRTEELSDGDLVWVDISQLDVNFSLQEGQTLDISIEPEIRESYPLQATATRLELAEDSSQKEEKAAVKTITAEEAKALMDSGQEYYLVDVRTQEEFSQGHIPGAILLSSTELKDKAHEKLPDTDTPVLLYCRSGRRSAESAQLLAEMGYANVYDFGGIQNWPYDTTLS